MYAEILTALANELETRTGLRPVKGVPLFGAPKLTPPVVALVCERMPPPPTRNGAASGAGALEWSVAVFGDAEATGLDLAERIGAWLDGAPTLTVAGRRVMTRRNGAGERIPNDSQTAELDHAFSVPFLTTW